MQVAILLNAVGEEAIGLFNTFDLLDDERNNYSKVLKAFEKHPSPKTKVVVK